MSLNDGISVNSAPSDSAAPPLPLPPPAALQVSDTVTAEEDSDGTNTAEYCYINEGCCLKILVAMCHGLCDDDGNPVLSLDSKPWKSFPISQIREGKQWRTQLWIRSLILQRRLNTLLNNSSRCRKRQRRGIAILLRSLVTMTIDV